MYSIPFPPREFRSIQVKFGQVRFKFDEQFKGPTSFDDIKNHIVSQARVSGFNLINGAYSRRNYPNSPTYVSMLHLVCDHNRKPISEFNLSSTSTSLQHSKASKSKNKKTRITKTSRPATESQRCSFQLRLCCYKPDLCWYLISDCESLHQASLHNGHMRSRVQDLKASISQLEEEQIQLAITCADCQIDTHLIASIINKMNKNTGSGKFTPQQIRYAVDKSKADHLISHYHENRTSTSAELLLNGFDKLVEEGSKIKFLALLHDSSEGYLLRLPKGRPSKLNIGEDDAFDIAGIRKEMQVRSSQKVLLAFAFATEDELRLVSKFPQFFAFDVTEKTNKEKRGLLVGTGIDGLGKIFIALHCYMPNSQMTSYGWVYRIAIPTLWGDCVVQKMKVIITDGEDALYRPFENLSETGGIWSGVLVYR